MATPSHTRSAANCWCAPIDALRLTILTRLYSTYWMNLLQSIPEGKFGPVLVTLNPPFEPKKDLVVGEWEYEHPLFTEQVRTKLAAILVTHSRC